MSCRRFSRERTSRCLCASDEPIQRFCKRRTAESDIASSDHAGQSPVKPGVRPRPAANPVSHTTHGRFRLQIRDTVGETYKTHIPQRAAPCWRLVCLDITAYAPTTYICQSDQLAQTSPPKNCLPRGGRAGLASSRTTGAMKLASTHTGPLDFDPMSTLGDAGT